MFARTRTACAPRRSLRRVGSASALVFLALAAGLAFGAVPSRAQEPQPSVGASIDFDWVSLNGWTPESTVSLNIGGTLMNVTVDAGGNAFVQRQTHGRDIIVGLAITASQGPTTKTLTVANLRIVTVDVAADTVSGVGPPSAAVRVSVNQPPGGQLGQADTTADFLGNWFVSFAGGVDLRLGAGMSVNASTPDEDSDYTAADRNLVQPAINASLTFDSIMANTFTPGGSVTFTIRSSGGAVLATGTKPTDGGGNASFNRFQDHTVDLVPAMSVTASDGPTTKGLTLAPLAIASIDPGTNVVSGTAPADAQLQVNVSVPPSGAGAAMQVTADAEGNWSADFTGTFDITPGTGANASVTDLDGDSTGVNRPPATINASLTFDNVNAMGFAANGNVTFTIRQSPGGAILATGTKPTDQNGNTQFNRYQDHTVDLAPGMHISAGDGTVTKGLTLDPLAILSIDPATDVVSGIAPADAKVNVNVNKPGGGGSGKQVTADAGGAWSADFSPFDVTASIGANASVQDQDLDSTGYDKAPSTIMASLLYDAIGANGFTPGGSVTFRILQSPGGAELASGTRPADSGGNASFNRFMGDHDVDLIPGMHVTAADALTTKELTLAAITITSVDPATDIVSGTAPANAAVNVGVYESPGGGPGPGLQVTAGPDGAWSVDFTGTYDVTGTTGARAFASDADGDQTGTDKRPSSINASLSFDNVGANGFVPNSSVSFTIRQSPGGAVLATGSRPTDGQGNAWFNSADQHEEIDLVPGMEITVSDATTTKTLTLVSLEIVRVDPGTDVVTGTATSGTHVQVGSTDGGVNVEVTAGPDGKWSADFAATYDFTWSTRAYASVLDEDGDSTGFDKAPATVEASLTWDGVAAQWFVPGANVNFTIEQSSGGPVLATGTKQADASGNATFEPGGDHEVDLVSGMRVTVSDGTTTKQLTLAPLAILSIDADTDVVSGTAPPGADVEVNLGWPWMNVTADGAGHWSADFTGNFDITFDTHASASVGDAEADRTRVEKGPSRIDASLTWDSISVEGFAPAATVTFTIRQSPGGTILATGSEQADGAGSAWFDRWDDFDVDLAPGMQITVTDGTTTKQLTLATLAIARVNPATNVVSGTASPGADVQVYIGDQTGEAGQSTTADPSGHWAIDFSPFDVTFAAWADARVADGDADTTVVTRQPPRISGDLNYDGISAEGFAAGATVTLRIYQSPGGALLATVGKQADADGNAWFSRPEDYGVDLTAGKHITVTDGTDTKELTLAVLTIGAIDAQADTVSGTAPPNTQVSVGAGSEGFSVGVTSDGSGAWSVDLTGMVDVTAGMEIGASVFDADWDRTNATRQAAAIDANLTLDTVGGCGFDPDDAVTVTIGDFSGPFSTDAFGCFGAGPGDHGKNLVPGMSLSVTDGEITRTLSLATLTMNVNLATAHVSGTAPPGAQVDVGYGVVDEQKGDGMTVTADGAGNWSADFGDSLGPNVQVSAAVRDTDGDRTETSWLADLHFSAGAYTVSEGAGTVQITVQRIGTAHAEVGASYATSNGSATAGSDYTATAGTLTFADGVTTQTFNVAILDDAANESDEVLNVTLSNPTGGAALAAPFTATITITDNDAGDTTPPETTILTGPTGLTNDSTPTFTFSANEASTFQCRVDSTPFAACSSPYTTGPLADGAHGFEVRATDLAGNPDSTAAGRGFTVDTTAPQTTIVSGPSGPTNDSTPAFGFSSEAGATFECSVDSAPFAACLSPHTTAPLTDGAHSFEVRAIDLAGNVDGSPATRAFTVDTLAPDTAVAGPSGVIKTQTPSFTFSSEAGATFECRVDAGPFAACTSPHTTAALPDGAHSFEVRAKDVVGNVDTTPAIKNFVVDMAPPETTIVSGPAEPTNDSTPTFAFVANEPGATFECRVDSGVFAACTGSYTPPAPLADGAHTFEVKATDAAGTPDPSPASRVFTIHTGVPVTTILSGPAALSNDSTPTFIFSADEPASFLCSVDGAALAPCSSPYTTPVLGDGAHTFQVRATDGAGNASTAQSGPFTVHTVAPVTTIVSGPAGSTTDTTPTFTFSADEPAGFQCRLDGAAFTACSSPHTTAILALGAHTFEVRAIDVAGNVDATPASQPFTIAAPVIRTTVGLVSRTVTVTKARVAPIRLRCGGPTACRGTITLKATVAARLLGTTGRRRTITLGQRSFSIPAGRTAIVNVKLNPRGFRLLLRVKRLSAQARVSYRQASGTTTFTRAITLKAPKRPAVR